MNVPLQISAGIQTRPSDSSTKLSITVLADFPQIPPASQVRHYCNTNDVKHVKAMT